MVSLHVNSPPRIRTAALRRALQQAASQVLCDDLQFLEDWEADPRPEIGIVLRARQIRRANPALAAEIRAELRQGPNR
jgi:hypothetical protein